MVQRPDDDPERRDERVAGGARPPEGAGSDGAQRPREGFDEQWAAIVADLEDVDWPPDGGAPDDEPGRGGHVVRPAADERVLTGRDWDGTSQYEAAEDAVDAEQHFVPPDPGPVLGSDPLRTLTWAIAVAVPLLYVVILVAWRHPPGWLAPVAGVVLLGAIGVLVWRMPHRRDGGDDDSGAVV